MANLRVTYKMLTSAVPFFSIDPSRPQAALSLPLFHPGDVNEHAQGVQIRPEQGFETPQTRKGVHELQVSIDASLLNHFLICCPDF